MFYLNFQVTHSAHSNSSGRRVFPVEIFVQPFKRTSEHLAQNR